MAGLSLVENQIPSNSNKNPENFIKLTFSENSKYAKSDDPMDSPNNDTDTTEGGRNFKDQLIIECPTSCGINANSISHRYVMGGNPTKGLRDITEMVIKMRADKKYTMDIYGINGILERNLLPIRRYPAAEKAPSSARKSPINELLSTAAFAAQVTLFI